MTQLVTSPVTLVVKAPNQQIDDQKIECTIDWTVNDLKQHLSKVYPTNPMESQQRIIYSGRLLQDSQWLRDVLKQYEPDQHVHIIHLVCSASMSQYPCLSSPQTNVQNVGDVSLDGVRRRFPQAAQHLDTTVAAIGGFSPLGYHTYVSPPGMMYYYDPLNSETMALTIPHPVAGFVPYGTQQWMQQAYAQSMMQYMQQYRQVALQPHLTPPQALPVIPAAPPANQNFRNEFLGAAIEPDAPNRPIRMNAHGGRDVADDDAADRPNRDWLDTAYALVRLAMLVSVLYFYSTRQRFLIALVIAALFYAYRAVWLRRGPVENRNQVQAADGAEQRDNQTPEVHQEQERSDDPEPEVTLIDLQATYRPSTFEFVWSIISSFFMSLIPENPAPMNVN